MSGHTNSRSNRCRVDRLADAVGKYVGKSLPLQFVEVVVNSRQQAEWMGVHSDDPVSTIEVDEMHTGSLWFCEIADQLCCEGAIVATDEEVHKEVESSKEAKRRSQIAETNLSEL